MSEKMEMPYTGTVTVEDDDGNSVSVNLKDMSFSDSFGNPDERGTVFEYKIALPSLMGGATLCMDLLVYADSTFKKYGDPYVISDEGLDSEDYKIGITYE